MRLFRSASFSAERRFSLAMFISCRGLTTSSSWVFFMLRIDSWWRVASWTSWDFSCSMHRTECLSPRASSSASCRALCRLSTQLSGCGRACRLLLEVSIWVMQQCWTAIISAWSSMALENCKFWHSSRTLLSCAVCTGSSSSSTRAGLLRVSLDGWVRRWALV